MGWVEINLNFIVQVGGFPRMGVSERIRDHKIRVNSVGSPFSFNGLVPPDLLPFVVVGRYAKHSVGPGSSSITGQRTVRVRTKFQSGSPPNSEMGSGA
jgi:hypothetical protein